MKIKNKAPIPDLENETITPEEIIRNNKIRLFLEIDVIANTELMISDSAALFEFAKVEPALPRITPSVPAGIKVPGEIKS